MTTPVVNTLSNETNCSQEWQYPQLPPPECVVDSNQDEIICAILIIIVVLITFYRLLHVWAYTLNFSEVKLICNEGKKLQIVIYFQASIQGPQGWDVVVNWIMERVKRTKKSTRWRMRSKSLYDIGSQKSEDEEEDDKSRSLPHLPIVLLETPSGATSPINTWSKTRSRPSMASLRQKNLASQWKFTILDFSSLRSSQDRITDPWMLSLHHVRLARSMRDFSNQPHSLSSPATGMQHNHTHHHRLYDHGPHLVRSYSCRSPPPTIRYNTENIFRQGLII